MNLVPGVIQLTADGLVCTGTKPVRVFCIHLVSGATLSTTIFRNGVSTSGAAWCQVDGIANSGVTANFAGGLRFPNGCYMDTDANISYCTIVCTEEF